MLTAAEKMKREYIRLPYSLLSWQKEVKKIRHRFDVVAAGRRSGKTMLGADDLTEGAATIPNSINWYVGPTYGAAKDIAWDIFKRNIEPFRAFDLIEKVVESDLLIKWRNGSVIHLKGGDKYDSLRGVKLNRLFVDEYAIMRPEVWEEVLQPSTADNKAHVLFAFTPKGYNHAHDLYQMQDKNPRDWKSWHIKTSEAGTISAEEIERARRDMDPRVFRQEYEASFEAFGGQVFTDFDRSTHAAKEFDSMAGTELDLSFDFGWASPMTVLFINVDAAESVYIYDELMARETPIAFVAAEIKKRLSQRNPDSIYCDPAGDSKNEALGTSPVAELRNIYGYKTVRYSRNYPGIIQDGISLIRKWLRNKKLFISRRCRNLIQALEMYRYADPKGDVMSEIPLKDGISDHWTDNLRYFFLNRFPIRKTIVSV